jgi:hypothetical protein
MNPASTEATQRGRRRPCRFLIALHSAAPCCRTCTIRATWGSRTWGTHYRRPQCWTHAIETFILYHRRPANKSKPHAIMHTYEGRAKRVMPASKRVRTAGRGEAKGVISIPWRWPWGQQAASEMPALPTCAMSEHSSPHTIPALVIEIEFRVHKLTVMTVVNEVKKNMLRVRCALLPF